MRPDPLPEPPPGYWFQPRENLSYVTPDVLVLPGEDGELEVQVNGGGLPPLDLSVYYSNLLLETPDEEVRLYLSEKLNQARSIVENINGGRRCWSAVPKRSWRSRKNSSAKATATSARWSCSRQPTRWGYPKNGFAAR